MNISNSHKQLKNKVFELFKKEGFTSLYQVSKKTKISQSTLSELKSGKTLLSIRSLLKICSALGYEIDLKNIGPSGKKNKIILCFPEVFSYNYPVAA